MVKKCEFKPCSCRRRQLVSIEESWNGPMSAEIPTRQPQNPPSQRNGASQVFHKNYPTSAQTSSQYFPTNGTSHKSFKSDHGKKQCVYNLPHQQQQAYNYFQQSGNILNSPNELGLMQHLQQQLRLQQMNHTIKISPNTATTVTASEPQSISNSCGNAVVNISCIQDISTSLNSAHSFSSLKNCDKSIHQLDRTKNLALPSKDSNKCIDEDLKNIISQKNLATTITENFLKTFGSDDTDIQNSESTDSFGKFYFQYTFVPVVPKHFF